MPAAAVTTDTPYYVLLDQKTRIGPRVGLQYSGDACAPIYGFSDLDAYGEFRANSERPLTPYPLTKSFLQHEISGPGKGLGLVVVDAAGPNDPVLHASTILAVLEAQQKRGTRLTPTRQLQFDAAANAYRVEDATE
jgi:hypothetical protein